MTTAKPIQRMLFLVAFAVCAYLYFNNAGSVADTLMAIVAGFTLAAVAGAVYDATKSARI